jgi:hypothetical protein
MRGWEVLYSYIIQTNLQTDLYKLPLTHSCPELYFEIIKYAVFKAATQRSKQQFIVYLYNIF